MASQDEPPSRAFRNIKERLDALNTPIALRASVADHVAHLEQLAERMRNFGMEDRFIERHIVDLFDRYETQLFHAMTNFEPRSRN